MKIYTAYSNSHAPLAELWLESLRAVEPRAEPVMHHLPLYGGNGDYGNEQFKPIVRAITEWELDSIEQNFGHIIGITNADVVFRLPFISDIRSRMTLMNIDALFQREREDGPLFNPGVAFYRCTPRLARAVADWIARMDEWDGHLPMQNDLMREAFTGLRIGLLPSTYANPTNGGTKEDPVLVHANVTPPPNSVEQKLKLMKEWMPK